MKRLFNFLILSLISICAFADATLTVSAPSTVEVGDKFRIQFKVNTQNSSNFTAPSFKGFEVIYGPSTSSQSSFSIINGHTTQSSSITYSFVLLGSVAGTYTIDPASIQADGKTIKSKSIQIKVLPMGQGGGSSQTQQGNGGGSSYGGNQSMRQQSRPSSSGNNISSSDLFMTATASRTKVFEQEAILLTYKLYTLVNITQLEGKLPTLDGFQIQEIPLPRNKEFDMEQYNGRNYRSLVWSQYVLFPQKSGDLVIPPITYEGVVITQNRNIDPIEAFFNGQSGMMELKKKIVTPQLTIHVSPLPAKPANFSGAVGKFALESSISSNSVTANDAVTLKVQVKGSGNMKLIAAPEIAFPKDFETYDAKVNDKFSLTKSGLSGTKEFEYLAVPRNGGKYTIPAAEFVYFDTDAKTYKTLRTQEFVLDVKKGANSGKQSVSSYSDSQQDVKELAQDIRFIKQGDTELRIKDEYLFGSLKYWMCYIIPLMIFLAMCIIGRKHMMMNADTAGKRERKANKMAQRRMKQAKKMMDTHNQGEFYEETMKALWGYVADKCNIPLEKLNKDNVRAELTAKGVSEENIDAFLNTLSECEFARYAPGDANENMEKVYNNTLDIMKRLLTIIALFTLTLTGTLNASAADKASADEMYKKENYKKAAETYEQILAHDGVSAELYYNLGNCYYKLELIPEAVLNYERALRLSPGDNDIRANLALARGKTIDKVTPPAEMFFVSWWHNLVNSMPLDSWAMLAIVCFILMLGGILAYGFMTNLTVRKVGLYSACTTLLLCILANLAANSQANLLTKHSAAIVMTPAVTVKSSPSNNSTDLFVIHEGSKVEILDDSMQDWKEVKFEEGKQGWLPAETIEDI